MRGKRKARGFKNRVFIGEKASSQYECKTNQEKESGAEKFNKEGKRGKYLKREKKTDLNYTLRGMCTKCGELRGPEWELEGPFIEAYGGPLRELSDTVQGTLLVSPFQGGWGIRIERITRGDEIRGDGFEALQPRGQG